jgi:hypothetical protein
MQLSPERKEYTPNGGDKTSSEGTIRETQKKATLAHTCDGKQQKNNQISSTILVANFSSYANLVKDVTFPTHPHPLQKKQKKDKHNDIN